MLVLLIIVALMQPVTAVAQSTSLGIDGGAGVKLVDVDRSRGNAVFSLNALATLGARIESDSRTARVTLFGQSLTFEYGSPFFKAGSEVFQLVAPARADRLVSTQLLLEWLPKRFPDRLTFAGGTLRQKLTPVQAQAQARAAAQPTAAVRTPTQAATGTKTERVVIIDPGHGGRDPGKVGANGASEKSVTLSVATKLAAMLRRNGYEVHLTRTKDTLVALADRPKLANQWKANRPAALFVSIHANAAAPSAEGYETYFLSEARTEDERRVAEMENAAVDYEDKSTAKGPAIDLLLNGLRNDYYQRASNDFAEVIQRELGAFHPGRNRGVKQAGFRVLVGALMPAVLVEIAFISNPAEARLLGTAAFQDKIAYSLARSISNFFETHEHLWVSTE